MTIGNLFDSVLVLSVFVFVAIQPRCLVGTFDISLSPLSLDFFFFCYLVVAINFRHDNL